MDDAFNRYFAMITAAVASITGLIMGFKALVKTFNKFEERVDNLLALTGLAGTSLEWLSQKAKDRMGVLRVKEDVNGNFLNDNKARHMI